VRRSTIQSTGRLGAPIADSLVATEEQHVESAEDGGCRHDPRRDGESQGHHLADPPSEGRCERRCEQPHGEPGTAARRGPVVRGGLEAADGAEEEEQVEVGEFDEGERAAEREVDGEADEEDPP